MMDHKNTYKGEQKIWHPHYMSLKYGVLMLSLLQHGTDALIVLSNRAEPGTEDACPFKRSLYKIVWSCVSTTIICALGVSPPKCSSIRVLEGTVATDEDDDLDDHCSGTYIGLGGQAVVCCLGGKGYCERFRRRLDY